VREVGGQGGVCCEAGQQGSRDGVGMHNCGFMIDHAFMRGRTNLARWREIWKRNLREGSRMSDKLKSMVEWCSEGEAELGECTVTVWTLECGVSFVGCGRAVCFLFLSFTSCIYMFIQDSPPPPFFSSLRLCFSVHCAVLSGRAMTHAREKTDWDTSVILDGDHSSLFLGSAENLRRPIDRLNEYMNDFRSYPRIT
jgi:hypothetical protein